MENNNNQNTNEEQMKNNVGSTFNNGLSKPSWVKGHTVAVAVIVVIVLLTALVYHLIIASHYVSTDDAYLTSDVVQISPQVSGIVKRILIKENQSVKEGQLLVVLDDSTYKATLEQRKADLDAAIAQAKGAGANVALITEQGNAQNQQAEGGVAQATSGISGAEADFLRSGFSVRTADSTARSLLANLDVASSAVKVAIVNKSRFISAVSSSEAQLESAKAAVKSAEANVNAVKAICDRYSTDAQRYSELVFQGAVSKQKYDEANSSALTSKAQLEGAREQVASAKAYVVQKQADLNSAKQQLEVADVNIAQAKSQMIAAKEQATAAKDQVSQAKAQQNVIQQNVNQAKAKKTQALGQLTQARTAPKQVDVSIMAKEQLLAKVEQARAALKSAELQLSFTRIYAPQSGRVSKKSAQIGSLVQIGTPLMALVADATPWVMANFKETQLTNVVPGCTAEIYVDAFEKHSFKAKVDSLSPATGSTFALLPADNASGNFTKVVQRIPVKIVLEPGQADLEVLSAGMSVVAKVRKK